MANSKDWDKGALTHNLKQKASRLKITTAITQEAENTSQRLNLKRERKHGRWCDEIKKDAVVESDSDSSSPPSNNCPILVTWCLDCGTGILPEHFHCILFFCIMFQPDIVFPISKISAGA